MENVNVMKWGSPVEIETRRRIRLAIWAYAYEFHDHSIVSDAVFDMEAYMVDKSIQTDRPDLDAFFIIWFQPFTGQWIHQHPELERIGKIYETHYAKTK